MEQIHTIELTDASVYPDEGVLQQVLQEGYPAYCALLELFTANGLSHEWRYYKDGKAWLCKVQYKKKTIVWISIWPGFIKAGIYIPERCIDSVYNLALSEEVKRDIEQTKNVGKSKPCMFDISEADDLKDFSLVMKHKMTLK